MMIISIVRLKMAMSRMMTMMTGITNTVMKKRTEVAMVGRLRKRREGEEGKGRSSVEWRTIAV